MMLNQKLLIPAAALLLTACALPERVVPLSAAPAALPSAETAAVSTEGDAADDPAIWVNPADPARSLIVAAQKKFGFLVYGLDGKLLQSVPVGRINNVDLRDGFMLAGREVALVAGSNRSNGSIALYALDHASGQLSDVAESTIATGYVDPYGLCMYRNGAGEYYVFVNDKGGAMSQWRLRATEQGRVAAERVREFAFATQPEGCVADDERGTLFVGEEDVGLWTLGAAPDAGTDKILLDRTGAQGHLVADVEGMAIWHGADGKGYLVVSSQGENAYVVYDRAPPHAYVGKFRITDNLAAGIDGVAETDGLDITSVSLGGAYRRGLLVVQDGYNTLPDENQNFKLVPWASVEGTLQLPR